VDLEFTNLLIVVAAGFLAPLTLGLAPALRLPAVVLEIVLGILLGPSVLGWVEADEAVAVMAIIGLAFLLFLAGVEIEFEKLRGRVLRVTVVGFALSFALAVAVGLILDGVGVADDPIFIAVLLTATSLGVLVPVLKDAGQIESTFGQLVIAAASIADFVSVLLLSFLFSGESSGAGTKLILIAIFVLAIAAALVAVAGAEHSRRISSTLVRLQDTSAQIRVRGAFVLLVGMAVLAEQLGLELILGAFAAGAILNHLDRDRAMTHPDTRKKLAAVGFGVFIPIFFVASGVRFDLDALFASSTAIASIPAFVAALLLARGVPALLYRGQLDRRQVIAAALLQATSLPFIVAATQIGQSLGVIDAATSAGFIAAGLVTVLVFPLAALSLLRADRPRTAPVPTVAGGSR
jgi:Kef-type K+ transport system membrane component KefB